MATKTKSKIKLTPEEEEKLEVKHAFEKIKKGLLKLDKVDEAIKDKVEETVNSFIDDSVKALQEEFDAQKQMELVKLTIASNQAKRIDKVSDIAYSYYQYTGNTIDAGLLAKCIEDLQNNVLSASSLVSEWTFEQFCVDNDNWENPMNVLLPEYESGMNVEDVWWLTYLFHDMSGHGQAASSLHMKMNELISMDGEGLKDELRKACINVG